MVAITAAAAHLGGLGIEQRHNRVIGQPPALHAPVIDNVAEAELPHDSEYIIPFVFDIVA